MKLEVGQFVRTKDGYISQYKYYDTTNAYMEKLLCIPLSNGTFANIEDIVKTSYNIIDILELGDVIIDKEGHKYPINYEFETDYNGEYNSFEITIDDHITLFLKDGLSIITHEQMEQMAYKVGEWLNELVRIMG